MHTCIHTYIDAYIHTYIHTDNDIFIVHTYTIYMLRWVARSFQLRSDMAIFPGDFL